MAIRHIIAMTNSDANRTNCMLQRITSSLSTQYCQRSKQSVANELGIVRIIPIRIGNPRSVRFPFLPRQILPPSVARRKSNSANSIRALLVLGEGKFAALNSPMPNSHTANIPKQKEFRYIRISQVSDEFATVGIIPGLSALYSPRRFERCAYQSRNPIHSVVFDGRILRVSFFSIASSRVS